MTLRDPSKDWGIDLANIKPPSCVLCGHVLPSTAAGDMRGARVDYCSPYPADSLPDGAWVNWIPSGLHLEALKAKHRAWLARDGQRTAARSARPLSSY